MSNDIAALSVLCGIVAVAVLIGIVPTLKTKMNMEQWTVGNRSFGTLLVWLLMGGEQFTTFTFLGASGWVYGKGAPVFYIITYSVLSQIAIFFIFPAVWRFAKKHGVQSQPEFFQKLYASRVLTTIVTLTNVVFMLPYIQLQLSGLGIIVQLIGVDIFHPKAAIIIASVLVTLFFLCGGIRAIAGMSIIKDGLMILTALFVGIALPYHYFGGIGNMMAEVANVKPQWLVLPGNTANMGCLWYVTTVLLVFPCVGVWPHLFSALLTARNPQIIKRNAMLMPIYSIAFPLVFFAGFVALLVLPGLPNGDLALFSLMLKTYPAWLVGIAGAAGVLTAMVPAAVMTLATTVLLTKNIIIPFFMPQCAEHSEMKLSRIVGIIISALVLLMAVVGQNDTIVALLLVSYSGIAQLLPGIVMGLFWKKTNKIAVIIALLFSLGMVFAMTAARLDPFMGINAGFLALITNFVLVISISMLMRPKKRAL